MMTLVLKGRRKVMLAHRLMYMLLVGEIPRDCVLARRCAERLCVRPTHVLVTTRCALGWPAKDRRGVDSTVATRDLEPRERRIPRVRAIPPDDY